jgi:hypothetical protein
LREFVEWKRHGFLVAGRWCAASRRRGGNGSGP